MRGFNIQGLPLRILSLVSTRAATFEDDLRVAFGADPSTNKNAFTIVKHIDAALSELIRLGLVDARSSGDVPPESDLGVNGLPLGRELSISSHCVDLIQALNLNFDVLVDSSAPGAMVVKPLFGPVQCGNQHDELDIFVAMPFRESLEHIFSSCIASVARSLRLRAVRGDNWESEHFIVANIWNGIGRSRLVIADCTGNNPNVLYEIGLAHSIGKPVIIITQNPEDVPHDIRHLRYIAYVCDQEGLDELEHTLSVAIRASLALGQQ